MGRGQSRAEAFGTEQAEPVQPEGVRGGDSYLTTGQCEGTAARPGGPQGCCPLIPREQRNWAPGAAGLGRHHLVRDGGEKGQELPSLGAAGIGGAGDGRPGPGRRGRGGHSRWR